MLTDLARRRCAGLSSKESNETKTVIGSDGTRLKVQRTGLFMGIDSPFFRAPAGRHIEVDDRRAKKNLHLRNDLPAGVLWGSERTFNIDAEVRETAIGV
jgi:hypothetical protein